MSTWEEWLLDVTFDPPCFVPYERDTDTIVFGFNIITARCPRNLVGVIHMDGQEAVEQWIGEYPDWADQYQKEADPDGRSD